MAQPYDANSRICSRRAGWLDAAPGAFSIASPRTVAHHSALKMSSGYYVPGEQRAAKVRSLFSRVASRYDLLNDLQSFGLHRHWKQRLISMARPQKGESAL